MSSGGHIGDLRRLRGLHEHEGAEPRRRGLRLEGTIDDVMDGLRALGLTVTAEPVENGLPDPDSLGVLRTAGSPWVDCLEADEARRLGPELAAELSRSARRRVFHYHYDFTSGRFCHTLFSDGGSEDHWEEELDPATARPRIDAAMAKWKMRDFGIVLADLHELRLPFPPTAIVEAGFLRLGGPRRSRFLLAAERTGQGG